MTDTVALTIADRVETLNALIGEGHILEAFDRFYAENVVMQEVGKPAREGKAANRAYEHAWISGCSRLDVTVLGVAVDEAAGRAYIEAHYSFDHAQWGTLDYNQVAAQRWKNGLIVEETFYHADWMS